jgi:hypothetical protein
LSELNVATERLIRADIARDHMVSITYQIDGSRSDYLSDQRGNRRSNGSASSEHSRDIRSDQVIWCTRCALRGFPHMPMSGRHLSW